MSKRLKDRLPPLCQVCGWSLPCDRWYCRGNVARYELWKLRLGTKITYRWAAGPVHESLHTWLGTQLLIEAHRRGTRKRGELGTHWLDAGYCLDAPELIPAGGCRGESFEDLDPTLAEVVPYQITYEREKLDARL